MLSALRDNLRRLAPERPRSSDPSRSMRGESDATDPWRLRTLVDGKETEYRFFFVCGFGKSGTNWLSNLLNLHPAVSCRGEFMFNFLTDALEKFTEPRHQLGFHEPYRTVANESMQELVRRVMLCMLQDRPAATVLGDRSPRGLAEVLPGAPTIWLVRDGRDVVVSYTYHYLRLRPSFTIAHWGEGIRDFFMPYAERFHASPPESCYETARDLLSQQRWVGFVAQQWAKRLEQDLEARESYPAPLLELRYEKLHADTPGELKRMLEFLGLDAAEAASIGSGVRTAPGFEAENPADFFRKGAVGDWRNYDTPAFREAFEEYAGKAADLAGYGGWESAA
ncbi:MAG: sulfotransferase [Phycisphaerales bacterium]